MKLWWKLRRAKCGKLTVAFNCPISLMSCCLTNSAPSKSWRVMAPPAPSFSSLSLQVYLQRRCRRPLQPFTETSSIDDFRLSKKVT
ncbi:hypothetical protein LINGRAHAP2_LOCUS19961 [Linum grandiflorum]